MSYTIYDSAEIDWDVALIGRSWSGEEVMPRYNLVPEKSELIDGKLFCSEADRLRMRGLLLENCGAAAVVRIGDPSVWRRAVAALDDPELGFRYALETANRRRDDFSAYDRESQTRFYRSVASERYREEDIDATGPVVRDRAALIADLEAATGRPDYDAGWESRHSTVERAGVTGDIGFAQVRTEIERHDWEVIDAQRRRGLPPVRSVERWREEWRREGAGWRLERRVLLERFEVAAGAVTAT